VGDCPWLHSVLESATVIWHGWVMGEASGLLIIAMPLIHNDSITANVEVETG